MKRMNNLTYVDRLDKIGWKLIICKRLNPDCDDPSSHQPLALAFGLAAERRPGVLVDLADFAGRVGTGGQQTSTGFAWMVNRRPGFVPVLLGRGLSALAVRPAGPGAILACD